MLVSVVVIGISKGIRIPKSVLDQLHISDTVDMEVEKNQIILKPVQHKPREGWDLAFQEMHENQDDTLLMPPLDEQDGFEWEW